MVKAPLLMDFGRIFGSVPVAFWYLSVPGGRNGYFCICFMVEKYCGVDELVMRAGE